MVSTSKLYFPAGKVSKLIVPDSLEVVATSSLSLL